MDPWTGLIFVAFIALTAALGIWGTIAAQKRRGELQALARKLNFEFRADGGAPAFRFAPFHRGHSRRAYHTLQGSVELLGQRCELWAGEWLYKETHGTGKDRRTTTYRFSYLVCGLPVSVPTVALRREGLLDKFAAAIGFDDLDFESAEFSARYHVKTDARKFAYALLDARMMEFLLAANPPPFQLDGDALFVHDGGTWTAPQVEEYVRFVPEFVGRWPAHVVASLREGVSA